MKVGVIGLGSIGQRHARNLVSMGHEVVGIDLDNNVVVPNIQRAPDGAMFWDSAPEAVVVCTPPKDHLATASYVLGRGVPVFIEKPVTTNYQGALELIKMQNIADVHAVVGYQLRHQVGSAFSRWESGRTLYIVNRQNMALWPGKYERDILEEYSHEIDIAIFLNGPVMRVAMVELSHLEYKIQLEHLQASSDITIEGGFDGYDRRILSDDAKWEFDQDENDWAYSAEMEYFLEDCCSDEMDPDMCTLEEAAHVVQVIEACRESERMCRVVTI